MTQVEALNWIAELFELDASTITVDTPRRDIATWDSLGVLTLMAGLDEKFDLAVTDDDMRELQKIGDIIDLLARHGKLS